MEIYNRHCTPQKEDSDRVQQLQRCLEFCSRYSGVYFNNLTKAYDSLDRTLGVPQNIISVIDQFHHGMRTCVRLDDGLCSRWFAEEQGLQGCVLAPLLFNIFFAVVINVAYTRSKVDKDIMDALVHLLRKWGREAGGSNHRRASPGDVALRQ